MTILAAPGGMGPLGMTLPVAVTPRVNATSHSGRKRFTADPCSCDNRQPRSALTHATQGADEPASGCAIAVMHAVAGGYAYGPSTSCMS